MLINSLSFKTPVCSDFELTDTVRWGVALVIGRLLVSFLLDFELILIFFYFFFIYYSSLFLFFFHFHYISWRSDFSTWRYQAIRNQNLVATNRNFFVVNGRKSREGKCGQAYKACNISDISLNWAVWEFSYTGWNIYCIIRVFIFLQWLFFREVWSPLVVSMLNSS